MAYTEILTSVEDGIMTLTLNRPDKLNAFTATMMREMIEAFQDANKNDDVRVIIVTGAGRGFCAGADISGGADAFDVSKGAAMFQGARPRGSNGGFVEAIFNCRRCGADVGCAVDGPSGRGLRGSPCPRRQAPAR